MKFKEMELPLAKILISPENVRLKVKDAELTDLMRSIKNAGLLQSIGVIKIDNNRYRIIYGHRRYLAIKKLGWATIMCKVYIDLKNEDVMLLNTIENLHRRDIGLVELGRVCNLLVELGLTKSEISVRLSIAYSKVNVALTSFQLVPKKYRDKVVSMVPKDSRLKAGKIAGTIVQQIFALKSEYSLTKPQIEKLFDVVSKKELSFRQLQLISRFISEGVNMNEAIKEIDNWKILRTDIAINLKKWEQLKKDNDVAKDKDLIREIFNSNIIPKTNKLAI